MLYQLLTGGLVSIVNFGIHAVMTGMIVVMTRHVAGRTDDLHVFMRAIRPDAADGDGADVRAHRRDLGVGAVLCVERHRNRKGAAPFEFAFENYTALGYGDAVAGPAIV